MNTSDANNWVRALALHKSDTFRKLVPALFAMGGYAAAVWYLEVRYLHLSKASLITNVPVMHGLLGFAISMLLVFRTNTAYDRWWEGRKLWGQLVNASRNLAVKLSVILARDDASARDFFTRLIGLFPRELKQHLQLEKTRLALDEAPHPEIPDFDRSKHVPAQIVQLMQQRLFRLQRDGKLSGEELIVLNSEMVQFLDICGACERIKNTPIPYSYSSFIKKFILIYVLSLPFGLSITLGVLSIPVVVLVFYVMASLELIAEEIEDPFGKDDNDLPMERLSSIIQANAAELLS
ncbi:MAG TPA: bestrophin family ion channel [Flavobacteriales bacterium]|nr:bestrophin family ion channel [Flavobacteriales bacterium]